MALGCRLLPYEQYCFALSKPQLRGCMPLVSTGRLGVSWTKNKIPAPLLLGQNRQQRTRLLGTHRSCCPGSGPGPALILVPSDGERQGAPRTR